MNECCGITIPVLIVIYCATYFFGVFLFLPVLLLTSTCNYYEPDAKVVQVKDLGMVDTTAPCEYVIRWTPMYTPLWSFVPRELGPVQDTLRLPCPHYPSFFTNNDTLYIDGCYSNSLFSNHPAFVHENYLDDYSMEITSMFRFRILGYLAVSPLIIVLSIVLYSVSLFLACSCFRLVEDSATQTSTWFHRVRGRDIQTAEDCELGQGTRPPAGPPAGPPEGPPEGPPAGSRAGGYVPTGTRDDDINIRGK